MSAVSQVFVRFWFLTFWRPLYSGRPAGHVRYFCSRDSLCTPSAIAYILKSMASTHDGDLILFVPRLSMRPYLEWPAPSHPVVTRKHFKEDHQKNKIHKKKIYKEHKIIEIRFFSFLFFWRATQRELISVAWLALHQTRLLLHSLYCVR